MENWRVLAVGCRSTMTSAAVNRLAFPPCALLAMALASLEDRSFLSVWTDPKSPSRIRPGRHPHIRA
jgi:hypothetical protein